MLFDAINKLRIDAIERGMLDLAIVYGWSALRISDSNIELQLAKLAAERMERSRARNST